MNKSIQLNESAIAGINDQSPQSARISIDEKSPMLTILDGASDSGSANMTFTDSAVNVASGINPNMYRNFRVFYCAIIILLISIVMGVYAFYALQNFSP